MKALALLLVLASCPKSEQKKTIEPQHGSGSDAGRQLLPNDAAATTALPPAPPLPEVPFGLPPLPAGLDYVTPDRVAMGSALFMDPRLSADGKSTCGTCHDPKDKFRGVTPRSRNANSDQMPPQLENLAWNAKAIEKLPAHVAAVMHQDLAAAAKKIAEPYAAHLARVGGSPEDAIKLALSSFVVTIYDGNSPWDHQERTKSPPGDLPADGYKIFTGKAHCASCHTPPLYTDFREHDLGFEKIGATRSLRSCYGRKSYFLAESALDMEQVIDFYLEDHPKTELKKFTLNGTERAALVEFLGALKGDVPAPIMQPVP